MGFFNPSHWPNRFVKASPARGGTQENSTRRDPRARGATQENAMVWAALGCIAWKMIWPGRLDRR
ncbi:hypothetical protein MPC4_190034 [Methylocella tundrae]|uniref:Uncharacterized protein n=1 Tax=Methylocella tundrae TaxID=227605 RepID=A0A8B6M3W1_METTU|nr:hypothetical protein MPC4_190034 [Methylocella tundrae]